MSTKSEADVARLVAVGIMGTKVLPKFMLQAAFLSDLPAFSLTESISGSSNCLSPARVLHSECRRYHSKSKLMSILDCLGDRKMASFANRKQEAFSVRTAKEVEN